MLKLNNHYFLLRHGQATSNLNPRWMAAWPEKQKVSRLTPKGIKEIKKDSRFFKKIGLDLIYSSDLHRTAQTAKIVARATKAPVIFAKDLRELNTGIFNGQSSTLYHAYFKNKLERFVKRPAKGESLLDYRRRIYKFFKKINQKHKGKKILIICHGDPLWLLEGAAENKTPRQMLKIYGNRLMPGEYKELKLK
jgi:broad specificity phosphatase PhoE